MEQTRLVAQVCEKIYFQVSKVKEVVTLISYPSLFIAVGYLAPEVVKEQRHSFSVDIW